MADTKITALTVSTTLTDDDILPFVDSPAGTPVTKKIAASDAKAYFSGAINMEIAGRPGTLVAETAGTTKTPRLYNVTGKTWTITAVYPSVDTAPTGAGITVVVWKDGSSTGALTVTISASANTGQLTGQSLSVPNGSYLQGWSTVVGSTIAGTDLSILAQGTTT